MVVIPIRHWRRGISLGGIIAKEILHFVPAVAKWLWRAGKMTGHIMGQSCPEVLRALGPN